MLRSEYEMTFYQWTNEIKKTEIELTEDGAAVYSWRNLRRAESAKELYYHEWEAERTAYRAERKEFLISNALMTLRAHSIKAELANWENGCIKAVSKHGRRYTYYATTGTIAGYGGTDVSGLQKLIEMCEA